MQLVRLTQGHSAIHQGQGVFTGVWFWVDNEAHRYGRVEISGASPEEVNDIAQTIIARTALEVVKG